MQHILKNFSSDQFIYPHRRHPRPRAEEEGPQPPKFNPHTVGRLDDRKVRTCLVEVGDVVSPASGESIPSRHTILHRLILECHGDGSLQIRGPGRRSLWDTVGSPGRRPVTSHANPFVQTVLEGARRVVGKPKGSQGKPEISSVETTLKVLILAKINFTTYFHEFCEFRELWVV